MKAAKGKVLVYVDLGQRSDYEVNLGSSGVKIFMNSQFGSDQKVVAATVATVIDPGDCGVSAGDVILCHHNTFNQEINRSGALFGDTGISDVKVIDGRERKVNIFAIEKNKVLAVLSATGSLYPLPMWVIVDKIIPQTASDIIAPPGVDLSIKNQFMVRAVGQGCDHLLPGITVVTYDKSAVQLNYTWKGEPKVGYRLKYENVLAIKSI